MLKRQLQRLGSIIVSMSCFALGMGAKLIYKIISIQQIADLYLYFWIFSAGLFIATVVEWLISNKITKGWKYFCIYRKTRRSLEKQIIDAGLYIDRGIWLEVPRITLSFSEGFEMGILKIQNSLLLDKKLDEIVMSSALGRYIVERHYQTDDENYYVYEIVDAEKDFKLVFHSYDDFVEYNSNIPTYSLFLDSRSIVKLQHTLLVGVTGSGKTYALYSLLLQLYNKSVSVEIYYADPKGSSLMVFGQNVAMERTAVDIEEIIGLLEDFVAKMRERKAEIGGLLKQKLDSDYSDFNLSPYVFCFDEYASFVAVLANEDKKTRDKVNSFMSEVVLQGRQLGFFMFIVMQKSDASLISTSIRDNLPLKIVLGNSEQQTYVTAFGNASSVPNRSYKIGEGVFTEPVIAPEPKRVYFPHLNFDILKAVESNNGTSGV